MNEFDVKEIIEAKGLDESSPDITLDGQKLYIYDNKILYTFIHSGNLLWMLGSRKMDAAANYKLLSVLNNETPIGKHLIRNGEYVFEVILSLAGVEGIRTELTVYYDYLLRQAWQGYNILNTASEVKRRQILQAHAKNQDWNT